jgi:hypothetical protein
MTYGPVVEQQVKLNVGRGRRQFHHVEAIALPIRTAGKADGLGGWAPIQGSVGSISHQACRRRHVENEVGIGQLRIVTDSARFGHEADAVFLGRIDLGSGNDAHFARPAGGRNPQGPLSRTPYPFIHRDSSLLAADGPIRRALLEAAVSEQVGAGGFPRGRPADASASQRHDRDQEYASVAERRDRHNCPRRHGCQAGGS